VIAMAGDLVPCLRDLADNRGVIGTDLPEDEERCLRASGPKKGQNALGARLDATLEAARDSLDGFLKDGRVVVLLDVDAERVDHRRPPLAHAGVTRVPVRRSREKRVTLR
jgi:hypothetical protein